MSVVCGSVQCTSLVHGCVARVCVCYSRLAKEGLKTGKKTGAFRTEVVCVCVCVGSSDLATVLIMWDKFWCNYSDLGAEIRNSGILLFVCWNR
jgi:hypothetical protein